MALVETNVTFPFSLVPTMPRPSTRYNGINYALSARLNTDDTWVGNAEDRETVIYLHGSGATGHMTGPLRDVIMALGYNFVSVLAPQVSDDRFFDDSPGSGVAATNLFRYGYGNVNAPTFTALWIKDAYWAELAVQGCVDEFNMTANPKIILGHSRGAAAAVAWSAGYAGRRGSELADFNMKGILASGATVAGLGDRSWNDANRNISRMSQMVALMGAPRNLMAYANNDDFGPPDYVQRLKMLANPTQEGAGRTYFLSAGDGGHGWTNELPWCQQAATWARELLLDLDISDYFGGVAIPGPVANPTLDVGFPS